MSNKIKIKRGNKATLPTLSEGELGYALDTNELYIGGLVDVEVEDPDVKLKLDDPSTLPTSNGLGTTFSPDGNYLVSTNSASPYMFIYKRDGDTFNKLSDPDILPGGATKGPSFSPDGVYLAVGYNSSPFITIYKRSGDTFTKLPNPSTLPSSSVNGTTFSPDGVYLAVAHSSSPYITIYKRNGDTFTKLSNPSTLPTGNGQSVSFSSDSTYLTVAHESSPYIVIYKRSGDTFTKLADPSILPTGNALGATFSPDDTYLSIAHNASPYITTYKRSGDNFTKLADPSTLPTGNGRGIDFSSDGNYIALSMVASPWIFVYKRDGDTFTKIDNPNVLPTSFALGTSFSPSGTYLSVAHYNSPYITIYKNSTSIEQQPGNALINEIDTSGTEPTGFDVFTDTSGSPGSPTPINDLNGDIMADLDKGIAYYGTVPHSDLFSASELLSELSVTAGLNTMIENQAVWHKYYWNNGIHFWRKPIRSAIQWNNIWSAGAVYGTGTSTSRKGYTPTDFDGPDLSGILQNAEVTKNNVTYAVRLMEGSNTDPYDYYDKINARLHNSEYSLILMNLHAATNPGVYDGSEASGYSTTDGVTYANWDQPGFYTDDDYVGWRTDLDDDDFQTIEQYGRMKWQQETAFDFRGRRIWRGADDLSTAVWTVADNGNNSQGWAPVLTVKHSSFKYE